MDLHRIVPFILIAAGMVTIAKCLFKFCKTMRSERWPSTIGYVFETDIVVQGSNTPGNAQGTYRAIVRYKYSVAGQEFVGDRVAINRLDTSFRSHAEEIVTAYKEGSEVEVFYDPAVPGSSVLEPGLQRLGGLILEVAVAIIFIVVGFVWVLRNS